MATAEQFFTPQNSRMCIFYEYIRESTPKQARNEFKKAKQNVELKTIMGWYSRFKMGHYGIDLPGGDPKDINKDDLKVGLNDEDEIKFDEHFAEYEKQCQDVPKFNFEFFDENLLGFIDVIKKIAGTTIKKEDTKNEYIVKEMEIFVNNIAQPKHVLIGIEYCELMNEKAQTDMIEIYHCDNGVVIRRGKQTKVLEGDEYEYINMAAAACNEILFKILSKQIGFFKIGADRRDDNTDRFFQTFTDLLNKHNMEFPTDGISSRLIHFGFVFNLKKLAIHYDDNTFSREDATKMKEMFSEAGKMEACYFNNETFDVAAIKSSLEMGLNSQETTIDRTTIRVAPQRIFMEKPI
ncbi:hypothetical protein CAEBREN_02870 [Caenorhabditis brenneri]|uniref:Uncharacterized protein n=1 Tax=Caenorhabditis brenneri TaxID=135651 RepID=G0NA70_CAEBE|nr:hypothetical protein CAEBREN_02870 [Caenorhabditis brenneri]